MESSVGLVSLLLSSILAISRLLVTVAAAISKLVTLAAASVAEAAAEAVALAVAVAVAPGDTVEGLGTPKVDYDAAIFGLPCIAPTTLSTLSILLLIFTISQLD